ncbi:MAG TPA: YciI family protein [Gemmatimonadaceae bacterium]|jgi:hypothetical protein
MPHYLITGLLPDDFDPSSMDEAAINAINAINDDMEAAGVRVVVGGLSAPSDAKSVRPQSNGDVLITDGPYLEAKEHVGGITIVEAANMDEALKWAVRSATACRTPVEVREIPYSNLPSGTAHPSRMKRQR